MEGQYNEVINAPDAWLIADEVESDDHTRDLKPTVSSRKIKSLIEQVTGRFCRSSFSEDRLKMFVTDRYSPLPHAMQKAHFLLLIQLPLLEAYHGRISSSLVAFETLSSIFVRAVPGALNFSLRETNLQEDPRNRTSGTAGSNSLCKALLSAGYIEACLEHWGEDLVGVLIFFFVHKIILTPDFHLSSFSCNYGKNSPLIWIYDIGRK